MAMKDNLDQLMRQAQDMQKKMQATQEEISKLFVKGEAGAGLVVVKMNGRHDVQKVLIDDGLLENSSQKEGKVDKEMLEDLIAAAFNDAVRKIESTAKGKLKELTAGMELPPGFEMPPTDDDE